MQKEVDKFVVGAFHRLSAFVAGERPKLPQESEPCIQQNPRLLCAVET